MGSRKLHFPSLSNLTVDLGDVKIVGPCFVRAVGLSLLEQICLNSGAMHRLQYFSPLPVHTLLWGEKGGKAEILLHFKDQLEV